MSETLSVLGTKWQDEEGKKPSSHQTDRSSSPKPDVEQSGIYARTSANTFAAQMKKSPKMSQKSHDTGKHQQNSRRRIKSDSNLKGYNKLLNVTKYDIKQSAKLLQESLNLKEHNLLEIDHLVALPKKKASSMTSIADMSKIITKYDEAERRYIGTRIELVKNVRRRSLASSSVWSAMPKHHLGQHDKKIRPSKVSNNVDANNLSLKLHDNVSITSLKSKSTESLSPKSIKGVGEESLSDGELKRRDAVANTKSERVRKFLSEALEANGDILGLGVPFRSLNIQGSPLTTKNVQQSHWLSTKNEGHCEEHKGHFNKSPNKSPQEIARKPAACAETNPSNLATIGNNSQQRCNQPTVKTESQKFHIQCIHFKKEDNKPQVLPPRITKEQQRSITPCCQSKHQRRLKDLQVPQAPPTTPINKNDTTKTNFDYSTFLGDRCRTYTH